MGWETMAAVERNQVSEPTEAISPPLRTVESAPPDAVHRRNPILPQVIGMLVFAAGLFIIGYVLVLAFRLYQDPNLGLRPTPAGASPDAVALGTGFVQLIIRIVLLFLASICGSLIANKGINLYFTALKRD